MIKKIIVFLLKWVNIPLVVITLLAYLTPYISPNDFWGLSLLGLGFPILLAGNALFFILFAMIRHKMALLSLFCVLLGWGYVTNFISYNTIDINHSDKHISVMSYNIRRFNFRSINYDYIEQRISSQKKGFQVINQYQPSIVCGQEFYNFNQKINKSSKHKAIYEHLLNMVRTTYPYFEIKGSKTILSKFPIINKGEFKNQTYVYCLWVDIQLDNKTNIRVYNVHLSSNQISPVTEKLEITEETIKDKSTTDAIKQVVRMYRDKVKIRANEAEEIVEHIKGSPYPVIVAGDFNDPILSYANHQFLSVLKDAFQEKGNGIGTTYRGNIPFLRLDRVYVSPSLKVLDFKTIDHDYSDHNPIFTTLKY